jgi:predicted CopG family antitoxin
MKTLYDLKKELESYSDVIQKISKLKSEIKLLEDAEKRDSYEKLDFIDKVKSYLDGSGGEKFLSYVPDYSKYPIFRELISNDRFGWVNRYETINVRTKFKGILEDSCFLSCNLFTGLDYDQLIEKLDEFSEEDYNEDEDKDETYKDFIMHSIHNEYLIERVKALKEAMDNNLNSFKYDW